MMHSPNGFLMLRWDAGGPLAKQFAIHVGDVSALSPTLLAEIRRAFYAGAATLIAHIDDAKSSVDATCSTAPTTRTRRLPMGLQQHEQQSHAARGEDPCTGPRPSAIVLNNLVAWAVVGATNRSAARAIRGLAGDERYAESFVLRKAKLG
jgi:hypothetical protein